MKMTIKVSLKKSPKRSLQLKANELPWPLNVKSFFHSKYPLVYVWLTWKRKIKQSLQLKVRVIFNTFFSIATRQVYTIFVAKKRILVARQFYRIPSQWKICNQPQSNLDTNVLNDEAHSHLILLYISTRVWVMCTPNTGQNLIYFGVLTWNIYSTGKL